MQIDRTNQKMEQPLIQELRRQGYKFKFSQLQSGTSTGTLFFEGLTQGLYFLNKNDLLNANAVFRELFGSPRGKTAIVDWSNTANRVRGFNRKITERLYHDTHAAFLVKRYPQPVLKELTRLYASMYADNNDGAIRGEIVAATDEFMLSLRLGKNVGMEVEDHTSALQQQISRLTDLHVQYMLQRPSLRPHAVRESYAEKYRQSWKWIAEADPRIAPYVERWVDADASKLEAQVQRERFLPHIDPTAVNINRDDDGVLRCIDGERAVQLDVAQSHLYAHNAFEPVFSSSIEERMALLPDAHVAGAYFFLSRQVGWRLAYPVVVPFQEWSERMGARVRKYASLLQVLCSVPQVRHDYRLAAIGVELDVALLQSKTLVQCTELKDEGSSSLR